MIFSEVTLGEISIGDKGSYGIAASAVDYSDELYTYLRITDIDDDGTLNKEGLKSVADVNASKYLLKPNDIVFARTGGSTGRSYFYDGSDGEFVYAGFLIKFSLDQKKVNPKYLKYYTLSDEYKGWIKSFNTGSTRGNINAQTYANMRIKLPSREQQNLLVTTLACLDDKIELNNRINKTLEKMAQAIFKSWFVDFEPFQDGEFEESELGRIPKGWRVDTLSDIANITMGQSPKGSSYNQTKNGIVFYQGRTDFGVRYPKIRLYTTEPKKTANKGDILLSVRAPVGDINIANENCCIGRGLASLKSKNNDNSFLLYMLLNLKDYFNIYNGEGTVFGSINKDTLNNIKVLIPTEKDIHKFEETVGRFDEIIENSTNQTQTLTAIRDSLLPKLMSGEIRVPIEEVQ